MTKERDIKSPFELTDGERNVLRSLAQGKTPKEIAVELRLRLHTIDFQLSAIRAKLYVKKTTEIVEKALEIGWLKPEEVLARGGASV